MSTREEFVNQMDEIDARLEGFRSRIIERADAPLLEGTWRIRDALSHMAARSNGVERILQRVEAVSRGETSSAPQSIDEINAGQVEERRDRSVEELLQEIREGHRAAVDAVQEMDDALLARRIPMGFRPGEASVAELLVMGGPRHDGAHLDQIEGALAEARTEPWTPPDER